MLNIDDPLMFPKRQGSVREGFPGQQMVVLPRPVVHNSTRHPLLKSLHITDAGFFPEAALHGVERPTGAEGTILMVCRAGCGWLRLGASERIASQPVGPGDIVLIPAGQPHAYGADKNNPWTIQWVHFSGSEVADWLRWHAWPPKGGVRRLNAARAERIDLGRIHEELAEGYDEPRLLSAVAALRWSLANIRSASFAESGESSNNAIEAVEARMREHYSGRMTIQKLAMRARLSAPHFTVLFRKRFGFAPIDYLLRLKIRQACNMLDITDWPVNRIASEVGIDDALYFSRRFRRIMGVSPREYRKAKKG